MCVCVLLIPPRLTTLDNGRQGAKNTHPSYANAVSTGWKLCASTNNVTLNLDYNGSHVIHFFASRVVKELVRKEFCVINVPLNPEQS